MPNIALCVILKAQPGKRDELKIVWEKHVKPHAVKSDELTFSCYSFRNDDPDTICLFEILKDPAKLQATMQEDWFSEYQAALAPLLAGPPTVFTADPQWIKSIQ